MPMPSICVCMQVGPGEVDGDLEGEIGEECSKYGEVIKVMMMISSAITVPGCLAASSAQQPH